MGKLYLYSKESLENLRKEISQNLDFYKKGDNSTFVKYNKIELRDCYYDEAKFQKLLSLDKKQVFEIAKNLHEALPITPLLASEESLWVYLSHGPLMPVVHKFWDFSQLNREEEETDTNYVINHWFLQNSSKLMRNGIASLWWSVEISKIEDKDDPYRLTRILFKNYTLRVVSFQQILRTRNVLRGVLEWFDKHEKDGVMGKMEVYGSFIAKYLNQVAGIKQLTILDHTEITDIIDQVNDVTFRLEDRKDYKGIPVAEIIYNQRMKNKQGQS